MEPAAAAATPMEQVAAGGPPTPTPPGTGFDWGDMFNESLFAIEDLLDFSEADVGGGVDGGVTVEGLEEATTTTTCRNPADNATAASLHTTAAPIADAAATTTSTLLQEDLPCDDIDIAQLEWLSELWEESFDSFTPATSLDQLPAATATATATIINDDDHHNKLLVATDDADNDKKEQEQGDTSLFRTSSPISVLEPGSSLLLGGGGGGPSPSFSSSSSSLSSPTWSSFSVAGGGGIVDKMLAAPLNPPEPMFIPGRARTKRSRPATFAPRFPIIIIPPPPPSSSSSTSSTSSDITATTTTTDGPAALLISNNFAESDHPYHNSKLPKQKVAIAGPKKKKKKTMASPQGSDEEGAPAAIRKCMHCEIQKTPQWRAGPMGPKTLCNACGVRYKSGRLYPEYRPAASPTFVESLHSNSHKKVIEMRIKATQKKGGAGSAPYGTKSNDHVASKVCELLDYIRRRE